MNRVRPPSDDPIKVRRGPTDPGPELSRAGCAIAVIAGGIAGTVILGVTAIAAVIVGFVWVVGRIGGSW